MPVLLFILWDVLGSNVDKDPGVGIKVFWIRNTYLSFTPRSSISTVLASSCTVRLIRSAAGGTTLEKKIKMSKNLTYRFEGT